jgi:hypothetical protein
VVVVGAILVIARIRLTAIIGANTRFAPSCLRVTGSRWFGVQSRGPGKADGWPVRITPLSCETGTDCQPFGEEIALIY